VRIAFVGTRGVPASYSGFETFVEQMGARLVERGHEVTVYCRRHHSRQRFSHYRGMRLRYVRGLPTKHLDTITHTLLSCLDALFRRYDVVVMCISGNSPLAVLPRLVGSKVVLNVDGSDWRRRKWGRLARAYIQASEWLATRLPDATVTDSEVMQDYYRGRFGVETHCIAYGADVPPPCREGLLRRLGLEEALVAAGIKSQRYVSRAWDTGETMYEIAFDAESERRYGGPYVHIHRGDLHAILHRGDDLGRQVGHHVRRDAQGLLAREQPAG